MGAIKFTRLCAALLALVVSATEAKGSIETLDAVQQLNEIGQHQAVVKKLESTPWDTLPTPELLMNYLSAESNTEKVARSLARHPNARKFADGYAALMSNRISDALRHFQEIANDPAFGVWGAIGLSEVGVVTNNILILAPAAERLQRSIGENASRDLLHIKNEFQAQLVNRRGNPKHAIDFVLANEHQVGRLFFCKFALGYYIDRMAVNKIADHRKKCKRYENWPSYELEINRGVYEIQGEKAAVRHMDMLIRRWPNATEVRRAKLELQIAIASGKTAENFSEYRELATSEPIFLPLLLRFAILSLGNDRSSVDTLRLVETNGSEKHQYAAFHLLVAKSGAFVRRYDSAMLELKEAHRLAPSDLDILYEGLSLSKKMENETEEMIWLERILEIRPLSNFDLERFLILAKMNDKCDSAARTIGRIFEDKLLSWNAVVKTLSADGSKCVVTQAETPSRR